jgi:hypothetical protein
MKESTRTPPLVTGRELAGVILTCKHHDGQRIEHVVGAAS